MSNHTHARLRPAGQSPDTARLQGLSDAKDFSTWPTTDNLVLASILITIGIPWSITQAKTVIGGNDENISHVEFRFAPAIVIPAPGGGDPITYVTADIMGRLRGETLHVQDPEHPANYVYMGIMNYLRLRDMVTKNRQLFEFHRPGSPMIALVHEGQSGERALNEMASWFKRSGQHAGRKRPF